MKRISNVLKNVKLKFVRLSVVVVKKQFVFNILSVFVDLVLQHTKLTWRFVF